MATISRSESIPLSKEFKRNIAGFMLVNISSTIGVFGIVHAFRQPHPIELAIAPILTLVGSIAASWHFYKRQHRLISGYKNRMVDLNDRLAKEIYDHQATKQTLQDCKSELENETKDPILEE
ncbi:hypothetical protein RCF19_22890 [Rhodococcus qingshengii]